MSTPPDGLPVYRVLTGPDDAAFCHRVSEAFRLGYVLHVGPAVTFSGESVIVAQALVWPSGGGDLESHGDHGRPVTREAPHGLGERDA